MKINGFPENSQIRYIGKIFKHNHLKSWNLKLCLKDRKTNFLRHTRLSNLPALAKRRYINPTNTQVATGGYSLSLDNLSTSDWQEGIDSESDGNTFVFAYSNNHLSGIKVHIPQIEFARILFFHNAYLARNCVDNGILSREFWIRKTVDDSILIDILPTCTLPLKTFNSEAERRLLAWILLDDNARIAYESIAKLYHEEALDKGGIRSWNFRFKPPQLTNLSLKTKGWFDKATNNYYVHEIIGISNVESFISEKVYFYSDKFKIGVQASNKGGNAGGAGLTDSDSIDDQNDANIDTKIKKLDIPKTSFSFASPIETRKVAKKRAKGRIDANIEPNDEFVELDLNTDEATIDGTACQADFSGLDDQSDELQLYMRRFEAFKMLIERLSQEDKICYDENLHFLPAVGRSRLHRTIDGNRRSLLELQLKTKTAYFIVLEIDMNDTDRMLSTLIIKVEGFEQWDQQLEKTLQLIVQRSINWPTDVYLLKHFGVAKRLKHPSGSSKLIETNIEFDGWLNRLTNILEI
ncbi:Tn7-like element transposition protein TnsE [Psychrobacter arenosus]|uniref:Tn7-like element transposition protein TnsE n=1 Tax=Psychrobacter arenosus TaxID=256326 RepID=UPI00191B5655|nr:Tn7-like element transposition protein TnsE [Psychrobacter arenosus]